MVYPRVCGGTPVLPDIAIVGEGLSPRVRGNRLSWCACNPAAGSIPACAGEPPAIVRIRNRKSVYPRVCGGTLAFTSAVSACAGLSPRVRGNRGERPGVGFVPGSIPACAGEPVTTIAPGTAPKVYPRVCGGTFSPVGTSTWVLGLSPRVRGNLAGMGGLWGCGWSIPACAGEPAAPSSMPVVIRVYPRVCGGTWVRRLRQVRRCGLSPRVRGNLRPGFVNGQVVGSIPACAGEPCCRRRWKRTWGVYPRVCGGTPSAK